MYPIKHTYSLRAYHAWLEEPERTDLDKFTSSWKENCDGEFWPVSTWDELRNAVSFLTLMNKRDVLYFRGQRQHFPQCLPVLVRNSWNLEGETFQITSHNRQAYYLQIPFLQTLLQNAITRVGSPRRYILEHVPAAAASVLQHYELWPTHFVDVTRTLAIAVAFAAYHAIDIAYLYVFALPDLRGSITSDIDQHLTLARLEAVCPPAAKRPHHQDAYLVSRFPEPPLFADPSGIHWTEWLGKLDLMRRLVAKFALSIRGGVLPGTPLYTQSFLIPSPVSDPFAAELYSSLVPEVLQQAREIGV